MSKEQEKLDAAKAAAKEKAGEKKVVDVNTITFKKNSISGIVFGVLEKAKKPLALEEVVERATKAGSKNPGRSEYVAKWFSKNNIATVDEKGKYALVPRKAAKPAKAEKAEETEGVAKAA